MSTSLKLDIMNANEIIIKNEKIDKIKQGTENGRNESVVFGFRQLSQKRKEEIFLTKEKMLAGS